MASKGYNVRCVTSWCSHQRRGWCTQDDLACKDRVPGQAPVKKELKGRRSARI